MMAKTIPSLVVLLMGSVACTGRAVKEAKVLDAGRAVAQASPTEGESPCDAVRRGLNGIFQRINLDSSRFDPKAPAFDSRVQHFLRINLDGVHGDWVAVGTPLIANPDGGLREMSSREQTFNHEPVTYIRLELAKDARHCRMTWTADGSMKSNIVLRKFTEGDLLLGHENDESVAELITRISFRVGLTAKKP